MGYLHIDNLYKAQEILAFRTCYALEKIHGTSAHVRWLTGRLKFFSGGESHDRFVALFHHDQLMTQFSSQFTSSDAVTIYGEAYGGKQQGMSSTYGKSLKFIAFDVQINERWLAVPQAAELVTHLGLEFVDYVEIPTTQEALDAERDKPSTQALRNGIVEPKLREGIVLRPPFEVLLNNGRRVIAKYKRVEFSERGHPDVPCDPTRRALLDGANTIALEWVTPMRLEHVIDTILSTRDHKTIDLHDIPLVIRTMLDDIHREASGEIVESTPACKAIGQRTVHLFKHRVNQQNMQV